MIAFNPPPLFRKVIHTSIGGDHLIATAQDGTVWRWSLKYRGEWKQLPVLPERYTSDKTEEENEQT
jgi:alpha-tubulin suppressor-like RCC1 family protein